MSNHRLVTALVLAVMLLVSACSQQTTMAQPLNNTVPETKDSCAEKQCGENTYCELGQCMCLGGYKLCGENCILERSCCDDTECPSGKACVTGVCTDRPVCGFNEVWNDAYKECLCEEGNKYCREQGKCIPADSCCSHIDCRGGDRCAPTTYSATVCLQSVTKKCSMIHEGTISKFMTPVGDYEITLVNLLEGPLFDLKVNNDSIRRLRLDEVNTVGNGTAKVFVEGMTVFGGICKEYPD